MTNIAGLCYLKECDYNVTRKFTPFLPEDVHKLDLDYIYCGAPAGASIYVNPRDVTVSHGPNGRERVKMKTSHCVPRNKFYEKFELMMKQCNLDSKLFAAGQTIPLDAIISGICVKDMQEGVGRLTAEATFGMRAGDFDPHISIEEKILGFRMPSSQILKVKPREQIPSPQQHLYKNAEYVIWKMLNVMQTTYKDFGEGITCVEFILDLNADTLFFVDFYQFTSPLQHVSRAQ